MKLPSVNRRIMLILNEQNLSQPQIMTYVSDLLSNVEISTLFDQEEFETANDIDSESINTCSATESALSKLMKNLRIAICLTP